MKHSKKVSITATCLFILILACGAIYIYNRIDQLISAPSLQQLLENNNQNNIDSANVPKPLESNKKTSVSEDNYEKQSNNTTKINIEGSIEKQPNNQQAKLPKPPDQNVSEDPASLNNKIAATIQQRIGSTIDTTDLLKAGFILMSKLSKDEINFLFGLSNKTYTNEELNEVRTLLLTKLSAQDIETLKALADKYDKNLYILDPNAPIK